MLQLSKDAFARLAKNSLDGPLFTRLDALVQIFERPAEPGAQGRADSALSRAHKAN
jgi:hypothetical protein